MKLCMIGTGYVGLVSGVCFSDLGNDVICVEAPTLLNSNMWKTPEKFVEKIKNEINEVAGKI